MPHRANRLRDRAPRRTAALAALVLAAWTAHAQQAVQLDPITVSAPRLDTPLRRVPGAVGVVDEAQIQSARQGLGLDESLAGVPGLFMQNRYNFAQDLRISVRGFGARAPFGIRGVKVLVDGIPATLPDGQTTVDAIDPEAVTRMEVLRGSASSLYGNAAGGVIDISTGRRPARPFVEPELATGGHGFRKAVLRSAGQLDRLGYSTTLSELDFDGFRAHSSTSSTRLNTRLEHRLGDDAELTLTARAVDSPRARDPGGLTAAQVAADRSQASPRNLLFNAGEALDEQQLGAVYRRSIGRHHELRLRGYAVRRDFANRLPFEAGGQVEFDRGLHGAGVLYTRRGPLLGLDNRLLLGVDADRQRDDRQRYDNLEGRRGKRVFDQLETVSSTGTFLHNELSVTGRLTLTAGVRHDRVRFEVDDRFTADGTDNSGSRTLDELSPRVGASWLVSRHLIPYVNLSRSFETPTTTEFARCTGGGFVDDLDAQTADTYELGANGRLPGGLRYSAALFHIRSRDEIVSRACPGQPGRELFVNAGRTTRNGVELSLDAEPAPGWRAALAYTFSDFEFDRFRSDGERFDGNTLPGVPRHLLHAAVSYRHDSGWLAALDGLYTGELFADNRNSVSDDASLVVNARLGYTRRLGDWEAGAEFGVNNVLDESYNSNVRVNAFGGRHFEPAPERNLYGGLHLRYRFGAPRGPARE